MTERKNRERDDSERIEGVKVVAFYAEFANIDKSEIVFKKMEAVEQWPLVPAPDW